MKPGALKAPCKHRAKQEKRCAAEGERPDRNEIYCANSRCGEYLGYEPVQKGGVAGK